VIKVLRNLWKQDEKIRGMTVISTLVAAAIKLTPLLPLLSRLSQLTRVEDDIYSFEFALVGLEKTASPCAQATVTQCGAVSILIHDYDS